MREITMGVGTGALFFLLLACGSSQDDRESDASTGGSGAVSVGSTFSPVCSDDDWCLINPFPSSSLLRGVSGTSLSDVWAVGADGTLLHHDGTRWSKVPQDPNIVLQSVWASDAGQVWAVGDDGVILHSDGSTWDRIELDDPSGEGGAGPTALETDLLSVHGASASDVWVVGKRGTAIHFDGNDWTFVPAPTIQLLNDVWVSPGGEPWAVGASGNAFRYDGTQWVSEHVGTSQTLYRVTGSSDDNIWVSGAGRLQHYDGERWLNADPDEIITGLATALAVDGDSAWVFTTKGTGYRWNGSRWRELSTGVSTEWSDAWSSGLDQVLVVGEAGHLQYWDGERRFDESPGPRDNWLAIHGTGQDAAWVVGDGMLRLSVLGWREFEAAEKRSLYDVWSVDSGEAWAVGSAGAVHHFDGYAWSSVSVGRAEWFRGVWFDGDEAGWIVGEGGAIYEYAGPELWTPYSGTVAESDLLAVWGADADHVWAVGEGGTLLQYDGDSWDTAPRPSEDVTVSLRAVHGSSAEDVWAVGELGTILHFDGSEWEVLAAGAQYSLNAVWAQTPSRAWAVGTNGTVLAWDGESWEPEESGSRAILTDVWSDGDEMVWIIGEDGLLAGKQR